MTKLTKAEMERCRKAINKYLSVEFDVDDAGVDEYDVMNAGYTTTGDGEHDMQFMADIPDLCVQCEIDRKYEFTLWQFNTVNAFCKAFEWNERPFETMINDVEAAYQDLVDQGKDIDDDTIEEFIKGAQTNDYQA